MTISFRVSNEVKAVGVCNPVVAIFRNVSMNQNGTPKLDQTIGDLMGRIGQIKEEVLVRPQVTGFHTLYQALNSKVKPAGENLVNNCHKRGEFRRYNNLVDAYNSVALEHGMCIGAHDARELLESKADIIFKRALGTEKIIPGFQTKEETIRKGDLAYGTMERNGQLKPYAWLGKKDVDSSAYQLKEDSTSFLLAAIGHQQTSQEYNEMICEKVLERIRESCPEATMELIHAQFVEEVTV